MGIGFVVLIHLIGLFILAAIIAFIAGIATHFAAKEKRKRRIILAIISPFIGLYTFYFLVIIGSVVVSEIADVDIGIGDAWYVPLSDECQLLFIDLPEQSSIECGGPAIVPDVSQIQQSDNNVYATTYDNRYFLFNTLDNKLTEFSSPGEFKEIIDKNSIILKDAINFYDDRRNDIAGIPFTIVWILSLLISILVVYIMRHSILGTIIAE